MKFCLIASLLSLFVIQSQASSIEDLTGGSHDSWSNVLNKIDFSSYVTLRRVFGDETLPSLSRMNAENLAVKGINLLFSDKPVQEDEKPYYRSTITRLLRSSHFFAPSNDLNVENQKAYYGSLADHVTHFLDFAATLPQAGDALSFFFSYYFEHPSISEIIGHMNFKRKTWVLFLLKYLISNNKESEVQAFFGNRTFDLKIEQVTSQLSKSKKLTRANAVSFLAYSSAKSPNNDNRPILNELFAKGKLNGDVNAVKIICRAILATKTGFISLTKKMNEKGLNPESRKLIYSEMVPNVRAVAKIIAASSGVDAPYYYRSLLDIIDVMLSEGWSLQDKDFTLIKAIIKKIGFESCFKLAVDGQMVFLVDLLIAKKSLPFLGLTRLLQSNAALIAKLFAMEGVIDDYVFGRPTSQMLIIAAEKGFFDLVLNLIRRNKDGSPHYPQVDPRFNNYELLFIAITHSLTCFELVVINDKTTLISYEAFKGIVDHFADDPSYYGYSGKLRVLARKYLSANDAKAFQSLPFFNLAQLYMRIDEA